VVKSRACAVETMEPIIRAMKGLHSLSGAAKSMPIRAQQRNLYPSLLPTTFRLAPCAACARQRDPTSSLRYPIAGVRKTK
jgi:hypothetical protein